MRRNSIEAIRLRALVRRLEKLAHALSRGAKSNDARYAKGVGDGIYHGAGELALLLKKLRAL